MKKRNAIILTGFMRDYENTVPHFYENLADENTDLFIATWDKKGIKVINKKEVLLTDGTKREIAFKDCNDQKVNIKNISQAYGSYLKNIEIYNLDNFEESIEQFAKIVEKSGLIAVHAKVKPKNAWTLMRRYTIFYMIMKGWQMMEKYAAQNNIKYEKVCKIRADFERGGYYPKINWATKIPQKEIKIGAWNLQDYPSKDSRINFKFQDHFAIGNYEDMRYYFNIFDNLHRLTHEFNYTPKQWHAEYCMSLWLTMNNINCVTIK